MARRVGRPEATEDTASAKEPGLAFVEIDALTIHRRRAGRHWRYFQGDGTRIVDPEEVARLNRIALPPAYREARFCPDPQGHLLAVGIDARGRRQYRYNPAFRAQQEHRKFAGCANFGTALPKLRRNFERDLALPPDSREAVLAALVRILDCAFLRVGNRTYARENRTFGLTTLRNRHARLIRGALILEYRGKHGIQRRVRLADRSVLRIVRRCQDLPGQQLFQYRTQDGAVHPVSSNDVNAYLRERTGQPFTAKDFRTWHGSVIAFAALNAGAGLKAMLDRVAEALANTPAVARKAYVHPALIEAARSGTFAARRLPRAGRLSREERGFLDWLAEQAAVGSPFTAATTARHG